MPTMPELQDATGCAHVVFHDFEPSQESFLAAVLDGLSRPRKSIPCRFLYDERGSRLFEQICEQPEYYPTRTECAILRQAAPYIAALVGSDAQLIELGSGAGWKVRLLLDALVAPSAYIAVDISREHLRSATRRIAMERPNVEVHAVCADYGAPFQLPSVATAGRRIGFFPGSTIGNLEREDARGFLAAWCRRLGPGGAMIVGVDRRKPSELLHAAYDDASGVTAAFSKNLFVRANRELGADFAVDRFAHEARWSADRGCVEIHLRSLDTQTVSIAGRRFDFAQGERLHVEDSHKYDPEEFAALAVAAGFEWTAGWSDPERLFSVHYLTVPAGPATRKH